MSQNWEYLNILHQIDEKFMGLRRALARTLLDENKIDLLYIELGDLISECLRVYRAIDRFARRRNRNAKEVN